MLTEEEARTKWCPEVTAQDVPADADGVGRSRCIASECMAWRFKPQLWEHRNSDGGTWTEPKEVDGYGRKGTLLPHVGYCGKAGKP